MICISTRGHAPPATFREALLTGLAPDGGLYVPATLAPLGAMGWRAFRGDSLADLATAILGHLIAGEIPRALLHALSADALDFPIPLVPLDDRLFALELFHGPTLAFKDVGARMFARLLALVHGDDQPVTVLVATSGDTGGAVARAFAGVPGTRVVVLYPHGQVSRVQEAQFTTLGGNITALAVEGTFDDCQRLAKVALADATLRAHARLTSANSISLGRLLPQVIYYAHALVQLGPASAAPTVVVPSGNFGNLTAGVIAWRLGVPIAGFVAATTINDTVPRYLQSGLVEPRPSVATLANAMDVGDPSNLERLRWLFDGEVAPMRALIDASVHTDEEVRGAIRGLDRKYGYLADPHTAIAYLGAQRTKAPGPVVFLATAHPAKFRETVEPVIGRPVPLPQPLSALLDRPTLARRIPPSPDAVAAILRDLA